MSGKNIKKLQEIEEKYSQLSKLLTEPAIIQNPKLLQKYSKEQKQIEGVMELWKNYKKLQDQLENIKVMVQEEQGELSCEPCDVESGRGYASNRCYEQDEEYSEEDETGPEDGERTADDLAVELVPGDGIVADGLAPEEAEADAGEVDWVEEGIELRVQVRVERASRPVGGPPQKGHGGSRE